MTTFLLIVGWFVIAGVVLRALARRIVEVAHEAYNAYTIPVLRDVIEDEQ